MKLKFEAWNDESEGKYSLIQVGPAGNKARGQLIGRAQVVEVFEAECHFDLMTQYHKYRGWGKYTTDHKQDYWIYKNKLGDLDKSNIWKTI